MTDRGSNVSNRYEAGPTANSELNINDITIRTDLRSGDIGYVIYLHGILYKREYDYGIEFESYVAAGLFEFYKSYDPDRNRVWVCEHNSRIVGFLLLMDRGEAAQLRYFLICPEYRGIGLGKRLMELYMEFFYQCGYKSSYLWTTHELETAARLYQRHGFKLAEEKESTVFGKPLIEQKYELVPPSTASDRLQRRHLVGEPIHPRRRERRPKGTSDTRL